MAAIVTIGEGLVELGVDEDDLDGAIRRGYGGDAANTAVMAARLGANARLCSRVGDDALGRALRAFWARAGIDLRWLIVDNEAPTGVYVNERLREGGSRFHYHRRGSAGSRLSRADAGDDLLEGAGVVHYTGVTLAISSTAADAARDAARRARGRGIRVSFAVNYRPTLGADAAELAAEARTADFVFVSSDEARDVFGTDAAIEPLADGSREVIVTAGAGGATVGAGGERLHIRAPAADAVDPTGAGDALAAVYLVGRLDGLAPARALERAVAAASLSCGSFGCALSYPDAASIDALIPG